MTTSKDGFVSRVVIVISSTEFPSVLSPLSETSLTSSVPWGELAVAVTWLWIICASIASWLTTNRTIYVSVSPTSSVPISSVASTEVWPLFVVVQVRDHCV